MQIYSFNNNSIMLCQNVFYLFFTFDTVLLCIYKIVTETDSDIERAKGQVVPVECAVINSSHTLFVHASHSHQYVTNCSAI